jgi:hypothetical protein
MSMFQLAMLASRSLQLGQLPELWPMMIPPHWMQ